MFFCFVKSLFNKKNVGRLFAFHFFGRASILVVLLACLIWPSLALSLTNHHDYFPHGWQKVNLYGAKKVSDQMIDFDPTVEGEETRREEFVLAENAGRALRLSHNGRVFCYVVDSDLYEPWDYQIVDYDGSGGFEMREPPFSDFALPRWTFVNYPFPYLTGRRATDFTGTDPSTQQLIDALSPHSKPCVDMYTPEQRAALTIARGGTPPPEKCAPDSGGPQSPADGPPRVALSILFEFDSDVLTSDDEDTLDALGKAMTSPQLANATFQLEGHTDAVGSFPYNMDLSRRRAHAVQRYLIDNFKIPSSQLVAVGQGENLPLPNIDPEDGRNRRVEVVNLSVPNALMTIPSKDYQKLPARPQAK